MSGFNVQENDDENIANANDFMTEKLKSLLQNELASRLTLNSLSTLNPVKFEKLRKIPITIIDVWNTSVADTVKENFHKHYPHAKLAHLKTGGDFPFLTKSEEVNLYIMVSNKNKIRVRVDFLDNLFVS